MYPGPSPSTWSSWYPHAGKGQGKANLFEAPSALSAIQQLFQPGLTFGCHCINTKKEDEDGFEDVPKRKSGKPKSMAEQTSTRTFEHANHFKELTNDDDDDTDAERQWEILKAGIPGYTAAREAA